MVNIDISDVVVLGIIGFVQAVVIAMLGIILKRAESTKKDVAATKEQIVNDHPKQPNFREENDRRHDETRKWFWALWRTQETTNKKLEEHDDMLVYLANGYRGNRSDIDEIQDTLNPRRDNGQPNL